ncbi:MAG: hypothetical protein ACJAZ0_000050 [Halioglobus sp.]|jgi:hypothetical protein
MTDEFQKKLFENPDLFLLSYLDNDLLFVEMDRESYQRSIFCDARIVGSTGVRKKVKFSDTYNYLSSQNQLKPELNYIFHIAHCGSTLLARAIDVVSENLVCREPFALRDLAVEYASKNYSNETSGLWQQRFDLVTALLGRKYDSNQPTIIKANVPVNFMIPALLDVSPNSKGIFLYHTLEHYLLSILKSQNHQNWVKSVSALIGHKADQIVGISARQRAELSVPQLAAYLWLAQMAIYNNMLVIYPNTCSLNAEEVYNLPQPALGAAFEYFGQFIAPEKVSTIVEGQLFSHYSKIPTVKFDNTMRLNMREELGTLLASELIEARAWVEKFNTNHLIPDKLPRPLTGDSPNLL